MVSQKLSQDTYHRSYTNASANQDHNWVVFESLSRRTHRSFHPNEQVSIIIFVASRVIELPLFTILDTHIFQQIMDSASPVPYLGEMEFNVIITRCRG
jgi:hypothetical protein